MAIYCSGNVGLSLGYPTVATSLSGKFNTDTYAFKIVDSDGQENYSEQWEFDGADIAETTSADETTTVAEEVGS